MVNVSLGLLAVCLSWVTLRLAVAAQPPRPTTRPFPPLVDRGDATLELINQHLRRDGNVYCQEVRPTNPVFQPASAFNWAMGVQLSALNAGTRLDPARYRAALDQCVDRINGYWTDANGLPGYADVYHPVQPDRYYDDNAWIVLGLLEAYELTGEPAFLARAKQSADFVFSGEDDTLGGGLYWRELEKKSKNTCSNAPGVVCALRLHQITKDPRYQAIARRLYAWTNQHLQDPKDGLFFDNLKLDGHLDHTKFSYNSALMIRANCLLFDLAGDARYLTEAQRIATSAVARWFKPDGRVADHSYFGHLLAESLLELAARDHDPRWAAIVHRTADFLWQSNRDPAGFHPENWDVTPDAPLEKIELMPQASAARLFFRLAIFDHQQGAH